MKKLIQTICGIALISFTACDKEAIKLNDQANASFAVIHAAPGAPTVDIVVDGLVANGSRRLSYGLISAGGGTGNGGIYMPVLAGTRNIKVSTDSGKTSVVNADLEFATNSASTIVVYDTIATSGTAALRSVRLNDDLTVPSGTNVHVRFLHLALLAPAVDITLVRTSVSPVDSVTLTNRTYLGANPNAIALSAFAPIPGGTAYTVRVKLAGTQTVVLAVNLAASTLASGRIVTLSAIGTARGASLGVLAARHL